MSNNQLRYLILGGIFLTPFIPLLVAESLFFPFITGKAFAFRLIVEIIFAAWFILALRDSQYRPKFSWIMGTVIAFLIAIGVADILSENPFKSFWSNFERMEGFIALLHFGMYFVVLGSVLKTQELWNKLLVTTLGASVIMAVYSFFQLAGKIVINQGGVRVDGTFGNASYLGIYMVFNIFIAALLSMRFRATWQRVLLAVVALLDIIVLYFTATRGAILGLLGGALITFLFLAWKSEKGSRIRKVAAGALVAIVAIVGIFFAVKDTNFVKESPVLSRFATLSFDEIRTQGRYYVWPMAWKGFLDQPIFGWGQESFNFVFNKYYNPAMYTQEPWFDRTHNVVLDWLIAGGLVGFLMYASIFVALLYYIVRSDDNYFSRGDKAVLLGLLAAYVFHNLFVFDQIGSYLLFFMILAYVHAHAGETRFSLWSKVSGWLSMKIASEKNYPIAESVIVLITIFAMYTVVYVPWQQNKDLIAVLRVAASNQVGKIEDYMKPLDTYTMGYPEALEHVSQAAIALSVNPNVPVELKQKLFDQLASAFDTHLKHSPHDARYRLFYGLFLSRFGFNDRAIMELDEAIKLSPNKQSIYFELVSIKIAQGKTAEAEEVAKKAFDLAPSYPEARFIYGLAALSNKNVHVARDVLSQVPENVLLYDDRYVSVLYAVGDYNGIIEVMKERVRRNPSDTQNYLTLAAAYLQANRRVEAVGAIQEIIKLDPAFKDQGEYYIKEIQAGRNP